MSCTVLLPGVLRADAGGAAHLGLDLSADATLRAALDALADGYPRLARRLRDERGGLRRYVNVYVNGEECRTLSDLDTPLPPGAEVQILPSIAGG